jgi:superfamily II DNA/RNA helicase/cold shock CspA family protein
LFEGVVEHVRLMATPQQASSVLSAEPENQMSPQTPSFASLGVPKGIVDALGRTGIHEPFPIQAAVLPDALAGRDILGRAPTGSGKTLAFGIPLVVGSAKGTRRRPTSLVLSPTRELAEQIAAELAPLARAEGHRIASVYGGVGYGPQRRAIDGGASILVACPGRLEDLLSMEAVDLRDVATVVVDEADRMSDMGFLPAVRRILGLTRPDRQVMLFSATLEGPVAKLTRDFQRDPVRHEVGSSEPDMTLARHLFWKVERDARIAEAARFVDEVGSTIVFTRTRHGADRLAKQLGRYGIEAAPIHGGRSQAQRNRALKAFGDGKVIALVATDVAARGIHVDGVEGVLHFDPPEDAATYVHRSGRTARAGASGVVLSLVESSAKSTTTSMQRSLGLPVGLSAVDPEALVAPRPAPDPRRAPAPDAGADVAPDRVPSPAASVATDAEVVADPPAGSPRRPAGGSRRDAGELLGKVATYSGRRGFGFIKVKGRQDVFVHVSGVVGEPTEVMVKGARVSFELSESRRGPVAVNVRLLERAG